jgi:hypothetical protein
MGSVPPRRAALREIVLETRNWRKRVSAGFGDEAGNPTVLTRAIPRIKTYVIAFGESGDPHVAIPPY